MKKQTKRINFEFPEEEYPYLKILCAKKGITIKKLATDLLLKAIEDYEDEFFSKKAESRLLEAKEEDFLSWDEIKGTDELHNHNRKTRSERIHAVALSCKKPSKKKDRKS